MRRRKKQVEKKINEELDARSKRCEGI